MEDTEFLHIDTLKNVKNHLEAALQADSFKTQYETAQVLNLVAFALFRLDQRKEALERTEQALAVDSEPKNIVSLANKAVILWHAERFQEAEECVRVLQDLRENDADFGYMVAKAKAEIAASYTRFGPRFTRQAVTNFNEVIPEGREPEVWVWKYGCALAQRHGLNLQHTPVLGGEGSKEKFLNVFELFEDIIQNSACTNLKAKAYAEVALLLDAPFDQETSNALLRKSHMTPLGACEKALLLDDSDASILSKTANLYRRARDFPRALELLLKANKLQPSSRSYHYLGLVYKALASMAKTKLKNDQKNAGESSEGQVDETDPKSAESRKLSESLSEEQVEHEKSCEHPTSDSRLTAENPGTYFLLPEHARSTEDDMTKRLAARIKSFPSGACSTEFSRSDEYVPETIDALRMAVDFSGRMNSRAVLDLAFMYKAMREFDDAIALYEEICDKKFSSGPLDLVTAYEQRGLILKTKAECEKDPDKQRLVNREAEQMLNRALTAATRLYSRTPHVRDRIGDLWHSFSTLLKSVEESDRCPRDKLREKANLFRLIKKHKESLSVLQEICQLAPEEENDPEHLKLVIENHVDEQHYSEAVTFIELLKCTKQGNQTMSLFGDEHFVQKVYIQAARDALLQGSSARHFFYSAFSDIFSDSMLSAGSCSESTDSTDSDMSSAPNPWDVMLLYDENMEQTAKKLADVVHEVCGLRVTRMNQDVGLGKLRSEGVVHVMKMSRLVVMVTGQKQCSSRELRLYISQAAQRASTVTLKVGGTYVPGLLKSHKSDSCPSELLNIQIKEGESYGETEVSAICHVFRFLVGIGNDVRNEI
ncbi:hypothetical protein BaRGS_00003548 [Batillaria attramentaria]|uniref:Tetratricopeptide repeat-containing protein n=1 Tax=Batillaria attramentaria TaxID=370345 RepID=A0ABD0M1L4_9CAEN